jgi:hypothetical protein
MKQYADQLVTKTNWANEVNKKTLRLSVLAVKNLTFAL